MTRDTKVPAELINDIIAGGESEGPTLADAGFGLKGFEVCGVRPVAGVAGS